MVQRVEKLGVSTSVTYYALALGAQDGTTGQYARGYTPSTINMVIFPHAPIFFSLPSGVHAQNVATGYTDTQLNEGGVIKDAANDCYTVATVSPIELGDRNIYYEAKLQKRFALLCPIGDQITNGGFETGDLTGWTNDGASVSSSYHHSGSYSCHIGWDDCLGVSESITQTFSTPIPVYCITELSLYAENTCGTNPSYSVDIRATYKDGTHDDIQKTGTQYLGTWTKLDYTSGLNSTKLLSSIKVSVTDCGHYVDVISLDC